MIWRVLYQLNGAMLLKEFESVRIDKWLWAVRICKTRVVASDGCKRDKVKIDGQLAKPSREVRKDQIVSLQRDGIVWQYQVLKCIEKRVSAKIAAECKLDITPEEDVKKFKLVKSQRMPSRPQGMGRPTKKDRREFDKLFNEDLDGL
ncbi:MAG: ribosome-associated heat shock protein Hsp15 [Candidatus Omnitrophota bacterium]